MFKYENIENKFTKTDFPNFNINNKLQQFCTKHLGQTTETTETWTAPHNFDVSFCENFECYYCTKVLFLEGWLGTRPSPPNFEIFLTFLYLPKTLSLKLFRNSWGNSTIFFILDKTFHNTMPNTAGYIC